MAQMVKNFLAMQETWVQSLGQKDLLKKGMATHSSILAWTIPWTKEPGGLQPMGSQRARDDWAQHDTGHIPLSSSVQLLSRVQLFVTPWAVALRAPLSMGFSRQEYWSGLSCRPPRDLPNPGIKPRSPTLQADSLPPEPSGKPSLAPYKRSLLLLLLLLCPTLCDPIDGSPPGPAVPGILQARTLEWVAISSSNA